MTTGSLSTVTGTLSILGGGAPVDLPFQTFVEELSVELTTGGSWSASVTVYDQSFDTLELAILAAEVERNVEFRFGWNDADSAFQRSFEGWIVRYQPEFAPDGAHLTLEIIARSAGKCALDRRVRSFPEGRLVSDMVADLAALNGWQALIETTSAGLETPFNSKGESDFNFIRDQLQKQARSVNGGSDYLLYFDAEDKLHFHTPRFVKGSSHLFRLARDMSGDVISFSPTDSSMFGVLNGGGNAKYTSPVSAPGGTAEHKTTASGGVNGEGAPTAVDAAAKPNLGLGTHSYVNLYSRDPAEIERLARARHEFFRKFAFQAELTVRGTHRVQVLDYARMEILKTDGEQHYLSGNFQVFKVKHAFSNSSDWTTSYELLREGVSAEEGTENLMASETVDPPLAAFEAAAMAGMQVEPG